MLAEPCSGDLAQDTLRFYSTGWQRSNCQQKRKEILMSNKCSPFCPL